MNRRLAAEHLDLLREVADKACPELTSYLDSGTVAGLSRAERERIVDALADEFCAAGIEHDGEPNPRGLRLECLIDFFTPYDMPVGWKCDL